MRVRVTLLTIGIRARLSCSLNISCSTPSCASPYTQSETRAPIVPYSPARTSNPSSERASSTHSDPSLAHHVSTLDHFARCQQEAEVAVAQERERVVVAAAATATRAARPVTAELPAARVEVEVEAAKATDAARVAAIELEALRDSSADNSISGDGTTNDEVRLAREAVQEQAT
jgi:hypothetical protein